MKKLFTFLLALVASVSTIYAQSGTCGDNLTWTLADSVLTISGMGAMENFAFNSYAPWYDYRSSIKSVIISDGVTSIGYEAFSRCSSLSSVTIGNSVTSIGKWAFSRCSSLTSVTIPNSVTSIGDLAFAECSSLTSITIPNSVTSIGYAAFYGCSSLTSVTIPNSVTSIGGSAFYRCSSLTSVTIPNSVTSIGVEAFYKCPSLTSVTINSDAIVNKAYNSSNLSNIFGSQVTKYIIGTDVKGIGNYAFSYCSSLTSITIPNSVTSIGWRAFSGCSSLTSITIPNSVTSIGGSAFSGCSSLTSVHITDLAAWCNIDFENYSANPLSSAHNLYLNGELVKDLVIPNSVTSIGEWAFSGCSSLTSITIPNSVISIGVDVFAYCDKLVDVYCYATTPPATGGEDTFSHYNAFLYVPCESKKAYMEDAVWRNFKYIECISSEGIEDVQSDEVQGTKVVKDGQVLILRNDKTYTMQGVEVK